MPQGNDDFKLRHEFLRVMLAAASDDLFGSCLEFQQTVE